MIKILHSVSNMDRAGIETMLMNFYRNIDRTKFQFDFLCNKSKIGAYEEEILSLGGKIFRTPSLNPLFFLKYKKYMKNLFANNHYDIIHVHNEAMGNYALYCARKNNVNIRIFHAHGSDIEFDFKWPLKMFCKSRLKKNYTDRFACSNLAAQFYFGKKKSQDHDYVEVNNAIYINKFIYNEDIRNKIRRENNLSESLVIGHVGRFMYQKNHNFILDIFKEYLKKDSNAKLILIGDGELESKIKSRVDNECIKNVLFVGNVKNVNEWYQAFDIFILPSFWEGLPVVGIEAQVSGLQCIFSNKITNEVAITENIKFMPIDNATEWANEIANYKNKVNRFKIIISDKYDIQKETLRLEEIYISLLYKENINSR